MKIVEISSEAAHKVGGIYTVLKSKAGEMVKRFGEDYLLIGFYEPHSFKTEVEETEPPENIKKIISSMEKQGIKCYYGEWKKGDNAKIVLLDPYNYINRIEGGDKVINKIKYRLWENYGIESLWSPYDFDLNVGWAWTAGMFLEKMKEIEKEKIIAHFHEWMSGSGLLYLKMNNIDIKTIFTTHATTLGRTKASMEEDFIEEVMKGIEEKRAIDGREAYKYKLESKHLLEKSCAHNADIFTTVSEITAKECKYILEKKPDIITPNGIDLSDFPKKTELDEKHMESREKISSFLYSIFLPHYRINPINSRIFFISGRYEYKNKGIDIFLDALGKLNEKLKSEKSDKEVFALILVPTNVSGPKEYIMENVLIMKEIEEKVERFIEENKDIFVLKKMERIKKEEKFLRELKHRIIGEIADNSIYERDYKKNEHIEKAIELFKNLKKKEELPPKICYNLAYKHDKILEEMELLGLENKEEDRVKIIFYGTYVKPGDGFINMGYYDTIAGCDAGFFPSRYEPWGYTPIETAALKEVAVTSNMAGFGCFLLNNLKNTKKRGIRVVDVANNRGEEEVFRIMEEIMHSSNEEIEFLKGDAYKMTEMVLWSELIKNYIEAYEMVLNGKK